MAGKDVSTLFTRKHIHDIGQWLWYQTLNKQSAAELVDDFLSQMEVDPKTLINYDQKTISF